MKWSLLMMLIFWNFKLKFKGLTHMTLKNKTVYTIKIILIIIWEILEYFRQMNIMNIKINLSKKIYQ